VLTAVELLPGWQSHSGCGVRWSYAVGFEAGIE